MKLSMYDIIRNIFLAINDFELIVCYGYGTLNQVKDAEYLKNIFEHNVKNCVSYFTYVHKMLISKVLCYETVTRTHKEDLAYLH